MKPAGKRIEIVPLSGRYSQAIGNTREGNRRRSIIGFSTFVAPPQPPSSSPIPILWQTSYDSSSCPPYTEAEPIATRRSVWTVTSIMTNRSSAFDTASSQNLQLWVELQVEAPAEATCPLIDLENQFDAMERDHYAGVCTLDIEVREEERSPSGKRRLTQTMDHNCLCQVFLQHGCSPRFISSRGTSGVIATRLPDRETLRELVADIRSVGGRASVRKLTTLSTATDADHIRTFELDVLTAKERAVMESAVARGYYDRPRRVNLGDLAEEFDVTKQTLSTRLNSAEAKMAKSLIGSP